MDKKLIKLLAAIATDSRVLADYQRDPEATLEAFGLPRCELKELIDQELRKLTSPLSGVSAASSGGTNVTH